MNNHLKQHHSADLDQRYLAFLIDFILVLILGTFIISIGLFKSLILFLVYWCIGTAKFITLGQLIAGIRVRKLTQNGLTKISYKETLFVLFGLLFIMHLEYFEENLIILDVKGPLNDPILDQIKKVRTERSSKSKSNSNE